jgi:hypothetical protein
MVHFVLERAGEKPRAVEGLRLLVAIESLDHDAGRAKHGGVEARHAEAALFLELGAVALDELRVHESDQLRRIASHRQVDDKDPQGHADLRRRESDSGRPVHRFDHVVD